MNERDWAELLEKLPKANWVLKLSLGGGENKELELGFHEFIYSSILKKYADAKILKDDSGRYSSKFQNAVIYIDENPDLIPECQKSVSIFFKNENGDMLIKSNPQIIKMTRMANYEF